MHKQVCVCDSCGKEFAIRVRSVSQGEIYVLYFRCPNCKEVYMVSATDQVLRETIRICGRNANKVVLRNRMRQIFELHRQAIMDGSFGRCTN